MIDNDIDKWNDATVSHEEFEKLRWEDDKKFEERCLKIEKAHALLDFLEIPHNEPSYKGDDKISILDLYEVLTNEEKLNKIVSKLKLKAFW